MGCHKLGISLAGDMQIEMIIIFKKWPTSKAYLNHTMCLLLIFLNLKCVFTGPACLHTDKLLRSSENRGLSWDLSLICFM